MYIILVYDIVMDEEGKKILPKVFKICKKYLSHIQNSVFEGELKKSQIKSLEIELKNIIRKDKFSSETSKWMKKEYWGKKEDKTSFFL